MTTHVTTPVNKALQASSLWTFDTPGDAASGTSSTTWAPVLAEVARLAPAAAPRADRLAAYSQLVTDLRRIRDAIPTSRKLGPSERLAFGNFLQQLLWNAEQSLAAI